MLIEVKEDKNQIEYIAKIWMKNHAKIKYYFYGAKLSCVYTLQSTYIFVFAVNVSLHFIYFGNDFLNMVLNKLKAFRIAVANRIHEIEN